MTTLFNRVELTEGSAKQVAWAKDLRDRAIVEFNGLSDEEKLALFHANKELSRYDATYHNELKTNIVGGMLDKTEHIEDLYGYLGDDVIAEIDDLLDDVADEYTELWTEEVVLSDTFAYDLYHAVNNAKLFIDGRGESAIAFANMAIRYVAGQHFLRIVAERYGESR